MNPNDIKTILEGPLKPGEKVIFNNRNLYIRYRNQTFKKALEIIEKLIKKIQSNLNNDIRELYSDLDRLVSVLEDARYFARLSIGGNNMNPPETISLDERAFVDLIETMYSYSRSTRRIARHELTLLEFSETSKKLARNIKEYIQKTREQEHNLIFKDLLNMKDRIDVYKKHFPNEG
ncbi:MAG: hypothetical protein ACUVWP_01225 [bacterium]